MYSFVDIMSTFHDIYNSSYDILVIFALSFKIQMGVPFNSPNTTVYYFRLKIFIMTTILK